MIKETITILTTFKCPFKCSYCICKKYINTKEFNINCLYKLDGINNKEIIVTGGEPLTITETNLKKIFTKLIGNDIHVNTTGYDIKKFLYLNKFDITWNIHILESTDIKFYNSYNNTTLTYILDTNFDNVFLENILKKYPNIMIRLNVKELNNDNLLKIYFMYIKKYSLKYAYGIFYDNFLQDKINIQLYRINAKKICNSLTLF